MRGDRERGRSCPGLYAIIDRLISSINFYIPIFGFSEFSDISNKQIVLYIKTRIYRRMVQLKSILFITLLYRMY